MRALNAVKRLQGMHWGTSIASTRLLYISVVRSILEYATVVWDSARPQIKAKLNGVQRYALTAATGALHTSSTASLEFLCFLEHLQQRRDVITIRYVDRCRRLRPCLLRLTFTRWTDNMEHVRFTVRRLSPFAVGVSLRRYYGVENTDVACEPLPDTVTWCPDNRLPRPSSWKGYGSTKTRNSADQARARVDHQRLVASFAGDSIVAYTDGSCSGPAGPTGSGAHIRVQNRPEVQITDSVGIGTNNTAEMFAILLVVRYLLSISRYLRPPVVVHVCSDSQYCLSVLTLGYTATADHVLVAEVKDSLARWRSLGHSVKFHWTPGHCGINGNEIADDLANKALDDWINGNRPQRFGVALSTAKALVRKAVQTKSQTLWNAFCSTQDDAYDHVSEIRTKVGKWLPFWYGVTKQRRILCQLRLGHIHLNAYLYRFGMHDSPLCECGVWECREHFLMDCHLRADPRSVMLATVQRVAAGNPITVKLLLGGCEELHFEAQRVILDAVYSYVVATGRFEDG